jgi:hypothetical protein
VDSDQFDALAERLSAHLTRRRSLGVLGLLGLAGAVSRDDASGKRKKKKKKGKGGKKKPKPTTPQPPTTQPPTTQPPTCGSCGACRECQQGACVAVADGTSCGAGNVCDSGACRALRCGDPGQDCTVFISSESYTGNLGGLAGADAKCQALADAAGIPGTYMAWLSDGAASPSTRFPTKSSSPYKLLNGVKIADNWADLTDGTLDALIYVPDTGSGGLSGPGNQTWTGTHANGQPAGVHCNNWTSESNAVTGTVGYHRHALDADGSWSNWQSHDTGCSADRLLYCFQQA